MYLRIFFDWFSQLLHQPVAAGLFFIGACVGHTFFMVVSLNVLYAWPLPHGVLRYTRKIDVLLIMLGPLLFAYGMGFHDGQGVNWGEGQRGFFVTPYLVFCWVLGFILVPAAIILYHRRRPPAALVANQSHIIDVARELGYPPRGRGRHVLLTRLPCNQVFQVEFNHRTLQLPQLPPSWDGLTILHLSDLHFCGTPDRTFFHVIVDHCRHLGTPDLGYRR